MAQQSKSHRKTKQANLALAERIIKDPTFAEKFFFVEMLPKMAALAASYNRCYGLSLKPIDVAQEVFLDSWDDDWKKIRAFRGESSIHSYVSKIGSQALYRVLVREGWIPTAGATSASDYSLTLLSITNPYLRKEIVDLIYKPQYHELLTKVYVDKIDVADLVPIYGEDVKKILSNAQKMLIEQLLNTDNPYAEIALSSHEKFENVSLAPWHDCCNEDESTDEQERFHAYLCDVFGKDDVDSNALNLIQSIGNSLKWSDYEKTIFVERFINKVPAKVLAEEFNVKHTKIDVDFSRLRRAFNVVLRTLWDKQIKKDK